MQNLFRESLEDLLFSKLYYLDNYVDQEAIHCLEGPKMYEFALSLPDIVLFTEHNYRQQQRCCRWSASKGNLHIALSNLIQLQDCFMWKGPGPGDLQFGVQFNATRRPERNLQPETAVQPGAGGEDVNFYTAQFIVTGIYKQYFDSKTYFE
ncbi:hypothetical protein CIHG_00936 [Coccidioides immitis H538.4]|uniref:Uncharacterized protein n=2 Tax=Coccidioides immitis TaxID=5501 RepID=A0A0J8TLU4_COCIT|nr:hypothetical protein CISG_00562 [Coccidioides immitis RMSCC 3703]KMU83154.1 hypothetical protein CIHG_00936 [Coccidioides immitis H538.4]